MNCPKCQTANADDAQFCIVCGNSLTADLPESPPTPAYAPQMPLAESKTSGLAVAALVFGIISLIPCLGCFTFIPGLILGIVALVKIGHSQGRLTGKGLAIGGIVTSALALAILPILGGIFFHYQEPFRHLICQNNLRTISSALVQYQDQFDLQLPEDLEILCDTQNLSRDAICCPTGDDFSGRTFYVYRCADLPARVFRESIGLSDLILVHDSFGNHRDQTRNVLFADQSVRKIPESQFPELIDRDNQLRKELNLPEKPPDPIPR